MITWFSIHYALPDCLLFIQPCIPGTSANNNHNAHQDEYPHELIICAYEDLLSALQYNHIHRMDRLKDTAKGKIHKCQFRADGEK